MAGTNATRLEGHDVTFGVVIGTYGDDVWKRRGDNVANATSAYCDDLIHVHGKTLSEARNLGAEILSTDWLIFLDADDALAASYVAEMKDACEPGFLLQPTTLGCRDGVYDDEPVLIPRKDLSRSNYLIIGTACERERFQAVGGFRELPALEDWDLWCRMIINGAKVKRVPGATYVVNVSDSGRNKDVKAHNAAYRDIVKRYASYASILRNHVVY